MPRLRRLLALSLLVMFWFAVAASRPHSATADSELEGRLTQVLQTSLPDLPARSRQDIVKKFVAAPSNGRAMAVHPLTGFHAEASGLATNADASRHALELVHFAGRPCALIAEGDSVTEPDAAASSRPYATDIFSYGPARPRAHSPGVTGTPYKR